MSRVLIVEDEEALLEVFAEVVEDLGHQAVRAHDGEHALFLARSEPPDLVVSDHMMPRRSGLELLRALRNEPALRRVPFVLLSAALPPGREEASAFLAKPVDLATFEATVQSALAEGGGTSAERRPARGKSAASDAGAREEMLNWMAHELKTPLSAAYLTAQMLERKLSARGRDFESEHRSAASVLRQMDRMKGLVGSILDAARLTEGKVALQWERADLREFVAEVVADWRELQPQVTFAYECAEPEVWLSFDPARLRQVLDNLISNAVKYGGQMRRVEVKLSCAPGMAAIDVRDWGAGIPASELPNLFRRFHRADDDEGRGHGLGLYIAAALTRLHSGTIAVKSALGEGSTFTVRLPLTR